MPRRSQDILEKRKKQITSATYKVVSKKGYYNFTIRDIAREAGLSTGLVHYYFKDKDELLFTLLKMMNNNLREILVKELSTAKDPREKLKIFMDQAFRLLQREKEYFHVLIDFWTQINHNDRIRKANTKLYESYRVEIASILNEGIQLGIFPEMDVHYASAIIISVVQGMIIQYVLDQNSFNYDEYSERAKAHILDMVSRKEVISIARTGIESGKS
ncbi:MAG: TetR family transcriptional regulator [Spirochaetes bacterium]|nr:MAG: TetR family transcriptional regulator [Spirochaetota bacterium]